MKNLITLGFILVSLLVLSCVYVEKCVEKRYYETKVEADQCLEE